MGGLDSIENVMDYSDKCMNRTCTDPYCHHPDCHHPKEPLIQSAEDASEMFGGISDDKLEG